MIVSGLYNSRSRICKEPFGALAAGQAARFTINLPKRFGNPDCFLTYYPVDREQDAHLVPMPFEDADMLCNHYTCVHAVDAPGLYFYHFTLEDHGRRLTLRRGPDGDGMIDEGGSWQLTVYDPAMRTPAPLTGSVMYQIFPDRFCASGHAGANMPGDRWLHDEWGGLPEFRPNQDGEVLNNDYYGGDLAGIRSKLDYLQSLGVSAIYLNPVFEAHSNHRYNTADYRKIDPLLGDEEELRRLCAEAKARGISVFLDGVFSHTGSDSVYFNKNRRYGDGGAYNDPDSPYRPWYRFTEYPHRYESWWGFPTLPNVNETEPSYLEFICGEDGVVAHWMALGVSGFRLDVADELPDEFLDRLYERVKACNPDGAVIGEVWEDASNKVAYGQRRRYLLGRQMDSVMNYPFKDAILRYVRYGDGAALQETVMQVLENYPPPVIRGLMNSLSTHDTLRAITALGGEEHGPQDREWQAQRHYLNASQYAMGKRLFCLASILQFGLPGIPCVYYGDEAGLTGYKDPFNRTCYPWGNEDRTLVEFIRSLGQMRRNYPIFADADFEPLTFSGSLVSFVRRGEGQALLFAINRSDDMEPLLLPSEFAGERRLLVHCGIFDDYALGAHSGVVLLAEH